MENLCDLLLFTRRKAGFDDANATAQAGAVPGLRGIRGAVHRVDPHPAM
jgi:hypothetical protein